MLLAEWASRNRERRSRAEIMAIVFTRLKHPQARVRSGRLAHGAWARANNLGFGMLKNRTLSAFLSDQEGATAIEYALIASLIAVFLIGALAALGTSLSSEFAEVGSALK